jgi:transmembrane 9 superfamily protein 2/4
MILLYTGFGFIGGYVSARVYKFFHGEGWKQNFIYTPVCLPMFVFAVFFFLNLFKSSDIQTPVRTNQIPRQIPQASGYMKPLPSMLLVGVLPFGAIFVELYFIMNSIWTGKVYYMFGFLFLCFGLMVMTCATVTVLMIYFLLCTENYHWQWRAFFTAAASAIYVFAYAMLYWIRTLSFTSWTSGILYLGYSTLISSLFAIITGRSSFELI